MCIHIYSMLMSIGVIGGLYRDHLEHHQPSIHSNQQRYSNINVQLLHLLVMLDIRDDIKAV